MSVPQFRRVSLPDSITGILLLHSTPGRFESWQEFEAMLKIQPVDVIVALTPMEEIRVKSPEYATILESKNHAWSWLNFPIPDFGVPKDRIGFVQMVCQAADYLRNNKTVLVHCGAGIGRTGMFAMCVLLELRIEMAEASRLIKPVNSYPERNEQKEFVKWFAKQKS